MSDDWKTFSRRVSALEAAATIIECFRCSPSNNPWTPLDWNSVVANHHELKRELRWSAADGAKAILQIVKDVPSRYDVDKLLQPFDWKAENVALIIWVSEKRPPGCVLNDNIRYRDSGPRIEVWPFESIPQTAPCHWEEPEIIPRKEHEKLCDALGIESACQLQPAWPTDYDVMLTGARSGDVIFRPRAGAERGAYSFVLPVIKWETPHQILLQTLRRVAKNQKADIFGRAVRAMSKWSLQASSCQLSFFLDWMSNALTRDVLSDSRDLISLSDNLKSLHDNIVSALADSREILSCGMDELWRTPEMARALHCAANEIRNKIDGQRGKKIMTCLKNNATGNECFNRGNGTRSSCGVFHEDQEYQSDEETHALASLCEENYGDIIQVGSEPNVNGDFSRRLKEERIITEHNVEDLWAAAMQVNSQDLETLEHYIDRLKTYTDTKVIPQKLCDCIEDAGLHISIKEVHLRMMAVLEECISEQRETEGRC